MRLGVIGPEGDRLPIPGGGLVESALLPVNIAQVVVSFDIVGLEGQRLLESRRGLVELALLRCPGSCTQVVKGASTIIGLRAARLPASE